MRKKSYFCLSWNNELKSGFYSRAKPQLDLVKFQFGRTWPDFIIYISGSGLWSTKAHLQNKNVQPNTPNRKFVVSSLVLLLDFVKIVKSDDDIPKMPKYSISRCKTIWIECGELLRKSFRLVQLNWRWFAMCVCNKWTVIVLFIFESLPLFCV